MLQAQRSQGSSSMTTHSSQLGTSRPQGKLDLTMVQYYLCKICVHTLIFDFFLQLCLRFAGGWFVSCVNSVIPCKKSWPWWFSANIHQWLVSITRDRFCSVSTRLWIKKIKYFTLDDRHKHSVFFISFSECHDVRSVCLAFWRIDVSCASIAFQTERDRENTESVSDWFVCAIAKSWHFHLKLRLMGKKNWKKGFVEQAKRPKLKSLDWKVSKSVRIPCTLQIS